MKYNELKCMKWVLEVCNQEQIKINDFLKLYNIEYNKC